MASASINLDNSVTGSNRTPRPTTELIWLIVGQVLTVGGALAAVRALTEVLPPGVYGSLGLGMTAATLLQQLWFGPLCATTDRFFSPAREARQLGVFFRVLMRLVVRTGTPVLLVSAGLAVSLAIGVHPDWSITFVCACGFAIASGANNLLDAVQNASRCRHLVALHAGVGAWLRLALALLLVWLCGASASVVLVGYVAGSVVVLVSQYVSSRRLLRQTSSELVSHTQTGATGSLLPVPGSLGIARADKPPVAPGSLDPASVWFDRMWAFLWPSLSWGAFTWAFAASDRWSLQSFATTDDVGRYLVLYQLGYYPLSLLAGLVQQWVYPILFAQAGDGTERDRCWRAMQTGRRWVVLMAIAVAGAVLVVAVGHRLIFHVFVSSSYRDVSPWLPGMMLASGLFALGQLATLPLVAASGSQAIARCKIGSSCLGMVLNAAGAWWGGVAGVVVAQVGFSAMYAAWIMILLRIHSRRLRRDAAADESPSALKLAG